MATTVGRNDPCPCGSGRKYKNCCADKASWRDNPILLGAVVVLLLVFGLVLIGRTFSSGDSAARACPPGQVWSDDHGHCH